MSFLPQASSQSLRPLGLVKEFRRQGELGPGKSRVLHPQAATSERADELLANMLSSLKDHGYWERSPKAGERQMSDPSSKKGQNYDLNNNLGHSTSLQ